MTGRNVQLRPVLPSDTEFLYLLATSPQTGYRWRFNGYVPSVEAFDAGLWADVLVQFVVESVDGNVPIGHVMAYGASHSHGHVHFGIVTRPDVRSGRGIEASALMLDYLFATWDFHKIYAEVAGYNLSQFRSVVGRYATEEGRLHSHIWYGGKAWDQHILAIYRDPTWGEIRSRLMRYTARRTRPVVTVALPMRPPT